MKRILHHRPSPGTAFGLAALVIAIGGAAFAAIPDSSGVIHGCYDRRGTLRVVDTEASPPQSCRSRETVLSWNQQGPPGPPGGSVVARIRGGPISVPGGEVKSVPLSSNSWEQGANEFQELQFDLRPGSGCVLDVTIFVDGEKLRSLVEIAQDFVHLAGGGDQPALASFDRPLFEPGSDTTHTLTAEVMAERVRGCPDPGIGTLESFKVEVLGFR